MLIFFKFTLIFSVNIIKPKYLVLMTLNSYLLILTYKFIL